MTSILSKNQRCVLNLLAAEPAIGESFYLTGGTALAEYYLQHRLSEDLDFFSEDEVDPGAVSAILKKISAKAGITSVRGEQSFNRNLFFLSIGTDTIKTEFTYFPFERIEKGARVGTVQIDSLLDIAVNKVFTIYQKPRSRDCIDLYMIIEKQGWTIADLAAKAQIKFDTYLDPIQLGSQFLKATDLKDYPTMRVPLVPETWIAFFKDEAKNLGPSVLE